MTDTQQARPMEWQTIDSAPRDGSVLIARYAKHPEYGSWAMLRSVEWTFDSDGRPNCRDLGGWLKVLPLEPDFDDGQKVGGNPLRIPICYHADNLNRGAPLEWMPLPAPPENTTHD